MFITVLYSMIYFVISLFILNYCFSGKKTASCFNFIPAAIITGLAVRLFLSYHTLGHHTDMSCFSSWADELFGSGLGSFYSSDTFHDYPPGYMYILWIIGAIRAKFSLTAGMNYMLIKFPAVLCDIVTGYILYRFSLSDTDKRTASLIGALYIMNPAVIFNSSVWGQVDSVCLLAVFVSLIFLLKKKIFLSYLMFMISILLKPQALIISPVFLFAAYDEMFIIKNKHFFKKIIISGLISLLTGLVLIMPFGIMNVINQYIGTISSYPYATVNAFNFWALIGMNWAELNIITSAAGYIFILIICIVSGIIFFSCKTNRRYFITAGFLVFSTYMLSVKMHERYAFFAVLLSLAAYPCQKMRKDIILHIFISLSQVLNLSWILYIYSKDPAMYYKNIFIVIMSFLNLILLVFMIYVYLKDKDIVLFLPCPVKDLFRSDRPYKISKTGMISLLIICFFYIVIAFFRLGNTKAPESWFYIPSGSGFKIDFEETEDISSIMIYNGHLPVDEDNALTFEAYSTNNELIDIISLSDISPFRWKKEATELDNVKYIDLSSSANIRLFEIAFYDMNGNIITNISSPAPELFDEQDTVPERESFLNGTYFDEVYHARTAYEFINKLPVYEWTHPPLGKIFIASGIKMFGMTPFGWRVIGVIFGISMLPFMFIFGYKLTGNIRLAAVICFVFAFDFMHFSQTRIATIDVYITFFVILMYNYMFTYYRSSFYDMPLKKTFFPLFLSGICFGLGTAVKWTGIYAGGGLCVLFFITIYKRYKEHLFIQQNNAYEKNTSVFQKNLIYILLFCVFAFIIIPVIIYILSYIPYLSSEGGGLGEIIKNQKDMFIYHSKTVVSSTHAYSSKWYEWIIMAKPIWYYSGDLENGLKESINAFGNPVLWWGGIISMLYTSYLAVIKKDDKAAFILIAFIAQIFPWIFVSRTTFIYHYFQATPFLALSAGYSFDMLEKKIRLPKTFSIVYAVAAGVMFIMFYPVLSGFPISPEYVIKYLRWFSSWVFI